MLPAEDYQPIKQQPKSISIRDQEQIPTSDYCLKHPTRVSTSLITLTLSPNFGVSLSHSGHPPRAVKQSQIYL